MYPPNRNIIHSYTLNHGVDFEHAHYITVGCGIICQTDEPCSATRANRQKYYIFTCIEMNDTAIETHTLTICQRGDDIPEFCYNPSVNIPVWLVWWLSAEIVRN